MTSIISSSTLIKSVISFAMSPIDSKEVVRKIVIFTSVFFVSKKPIFYKSLVQETSADFLVGLIFYFFKNMFVSAREKLISKIQIKYIFIKGDIKNNVESLIGNIGSISSVNLHHLKQKIEGLSGNIEELSEKIEGLSEDIGKLSGNIEELSEKIEGLSEDIGKLSGNIKGLSGNVEELRRLIQIIKKIKEMKECNISIPIYLFVLKKCENINGYRVLNGIDFCVGFVFKKIFIFIFSMFFPGFMKKFHDRDKLLKLSLCFSLFFFVLEKNFLKNNFFITSISKQCDLYGLKIVQKQIFDSLMKLRASS